MKILIEGEAYPLERLEAILEDASFYITNKNLEGIITNVGYYYSEKKNTLVYMLPKVFMHSDGTTIFGMSKLELLKMDSNDSFKHDSQYEWIRQLSVYFYNSLKEFKRRHDESTLLHEDEHTLLNSNIADQEYTYLDLLLTFVNFYKKNKNLILFRHIQTISKVANRTNWSKTVKKQLPLINSMGQPVYSQFQNKKKSRNSQEELLIYFFSILEHFNQEHDLNLTIDKSYKLIRGKAFDNLKRNGLSKLRKIKYRYFSDIYKMMYRLCELYFTKNSLGTKSNNGHEFITIDNYNIIFEDMVDKLFSDSIANFDTIENKEGLSLKDLKNHPDGKILDHIYADRSLIDSSNIFYIGDSKYYKPSSKAGKSSQFKQFTYAKNVIQFNIDVLNNKSELPNDLRYRDEATEGYNISPNFFVYGYIDDYRVFEAPLLKPRNNSVIKSAHFPDRLFDRDTHFIQEYDINFLFVLKSYTATSALSLDKFRIEAKKQFRDKFIKFFNTPAKSGFFVIEKVFNNDEDLKSYVDDNFKSLNGRCISVGHSLLIAKAYDAIEEEDKEKQFIFT